VRLRTLVLSAVGTGLLAVSLAAWWRQEATPPGAGTTPRSVSGKSVERRARSAEESPTHQSVHKGVARPGPRTTTARPSADGVEEVQGTGADSSEAVRTWQPPADGRQPFPQTPPRTPQPLPSRPVEPAGGIRKAENISGDVQGVIGVGLLVTARNTVTGGGESAGTGGTTAGTGNGGIGATGDGGSGGQGSGGPGDSGGAGTGGTPQLTQQTVTDPPRFRDTGVPIGDAVDIQAATGTAFPLSLTLSFNPAEAHAKGVPPELIQPFFFDPQSQQWSTDGLTPKQINVSDGTVEFHTTHLTVFRLGVPRGNPPIIEAIHPLHAVPGQWVTVIGDGFSLAAAQNILTLGGAFVSIAVDAAGQPQPLSLSDGGETLILRDAAGDELDRAVISAAPVERSSWTRSPEGDPGSEFMAHREAASGRLFSPGTTAAGDSFRYAQGTDVLAPQAGDLLINEVLLAPPTSFLGDANGDGETNAQEDEFVELLNTTDHPLDLSGCRLVTGAGARHEFPGGTLLPGGMAFVIFGVEDADNPPQPAGRFGGQRFLPDRSTDRWLLARVPTKDLQTDEPVIPGTGFLTLSTFRQTSNPVSVQVLAPMPQGGRAGFEHAPDHLPQLPGTRLRLIRAADLDRDLDVDLLGVDQHGETLVLVNDGFGRFTEGALRVPVGRARGHIFALALTDLTRDGAPELVIGDTDAAGSATQLAVYENDGAGRFELLEISGVLNSQASAGPSVLAAGDVDGDGAQDVLVGLIGERPMLFRNDGAGRLTHDPGTDVLPQARVALPTGLKLIDIDQDGDLDALLSAGEAGRGQAWPLQVFINDGQGRFTDESEARVRSFGTGYDAVLPGDLDGDGDLDVVTGHRSFLYLNDGLGMLGEGRALFALAHALGDVDGDGDLDIVAKTDSADAVSIEELREEIYLNDGNAGFNAGRVVPLPRLPAARPEFEPADVDNDGDLDLFRAGAHLDLLINTGTRINRPPHLEPAAEQHVTEGSALQVAIQATDADDDPIVLTAQLVDGGALTTLGATFTDAGNGQGTLDWTPAVGQGGRPGRAYDIVIRASDGLATDQATLRIVVGKLNRPPVLTAVGDLTVDELSPVSIQLQASDPDVADGDALTFGAANLPGGAVLNGSTGLFQWTPTAQQGDGPGPGGQQEYAITFTVTDLLEETASDGMTVTVRNVNHAPVFASLETDRAVIEGLELAFTVGATDPDGEAVAVSMEEGPSGAQFNASTRLFSWTPGFAQARTQPYTVRFEATDGEATAALTVTIRVKNENRAPAFVGLVDHSVGEGETLVFDVAVQDLDTDPLTVSIVSGLPAGAAFNPLTLHFNWTPAFDQSGAHDVTFQVSDGLAAVRQTIRIFASNVGRSPLLSPIADQTILEGRLLQIPILASDPDNDPLTITVDPLPAGGQIIQQGGLRALQWVPGPAQDGVYELRLSVSDGVLEVVDLFTVIVLNNPGFQPLVGAAGFISPDTAAAGAPLARFDETAMVSLTPGASVGLDMGAIHPALISTIELFHVAQVGTLSESDFQLFVSQDNAAFTPYDGPLVFSRAGNRMVFSGLNIPERFVKVHRKPLSVTVPAPGPVDFMIDLQNFLPQLVRASGAINLTGSQEALLSDLARRAFNYFAEHVSANGLIPDRVAVTGGQAIPSAIYSTAATGFWLASLPIAVERGWLTREQATAFARRTMEFFLGRNGGPVEGQFGFYYHFLNADGTRFTDFSGDGVSILDSSILFMGALACAEYFDAELTGLAMELFNRADWDAFYDHEANMLRLFWTPEGGFIRHLDYTSEGILAYLMAAGSATHPVQPDPDLANGADAYYAFSRGSFGRVLGHFGREGRPLLQSFFGSLFTYLYPPVLVDLSGQRDQFHLDWEANTREAILANFRFAQAHTEFGYSRVNWGISASDGPFGYQGLYGTPPLDTGAQGERHDGTVAPYALAGSLPFAADLALPALEHLAMVNGGVLLDRYGLRDGINLQQNFMAAGYLGIDMGSLLLGLERYRGGSATRLVRESGVLQRAFEALGMQPATAHRLISQGPRAAHAYLRLDTTDHLTQTVEVRASVLTLAGEYLLELHPYGMDTSEGQRYVDVDVAVNGQFVKTVRFTDRRGNGTVDVGNVYVPISQSFMNAGIDDVNAITLTWVGGERWVQLEDVEVIPPTGAGSSQNTWQIGVQDGSFREFGNERLVDDSHRVGDALSTLEQALNAVDEPATDLLFELSDIDADRLLRLRTAETQHNLSAAIEISVNSAVVGHVMLGPLAEDAIEIPRRFLRSGWNHIAVRHTARRGDAEFILWDTMALDRSSGAGQLNVTIRNIADNQEAAQVQFGASPPEGAVLAAQQYLEIQYVDGPSFERLTISTDNRDAPIHRFTGPPEASAAGLVGEIDSSVAAPLLWQVYDEWLVVAPAFTDTIEWAFVPDQSESGFQSPEAIEFRSLVRGNTLAERPLGGRSGSPPIFVYLVVDVRGKPGQTYGMDGLIIERFEQ